MPSIALFLGAVLKSVKKITASADGHKSPRVAAHAASKEAAILVSQTHLILVGSMARTFLC